MNFLILGNGAEELSWARWLNEQNDHRLAAAFPGFSDPSLSGIATASDLDGALAQPGIDAAIVGGPIEQRGESLRRAAAEGLAIICLHPAGDDSEAYYQVSLSRAETGAVIVPDLPLRLHPGVEAIRQVMVRGELGAFRGIRYEFPSQGEGIDLARVVFSRCVDVIRALVGEIEALTATGDPPGARPDIELLVQLRAAQTQRAELRIWSGLEPTARLTLLGSQGSMTLEFDNLHAQSARSDPAHHTSGRRDTGPRPMGRSRCDYFRVGDVSGRSFRHRFSQSEPPRRDTGHGGDRGDRA